MPTCDKTQYVLSRKDSERIQILKIWFTIMVIFIHSYSAEVTFSSGNIELQVPVWLDWIKYIVSQIIARSAVPGYFFISAVLLYKKDFTWLENIKKKCKTLMVPYILLNSFWILFYFAAQSIPLLNVYFANEKYMIANWDILDFIDAYIGFKNSYPLLYPLWFIRDLMVLNVVAVALKWIIDKFPRATFLLLVLAVLANIQTHLFFARQTSIIFFCLGYYFVKYNVRFSDLERINMPLLILVYAGSVALDCFTRDKPIQYLPHFCSILTGVILFYRLTAIPKSLKLRGRLLQIAAYSFPVYLFHEMNLTILTKLAAKLLPSTIGLQILIYFGLPFILFTLCCALSIFLDRYFHGLYMVLVGGRSR